MYFIPFSLDCQGLCGIFVKSWEKSIFRPNTVDNRKKYEYESNIADDLGADSLDVVDLVMSLEEEFDAEFPDEDIESIKTVGDVVKFIEDRI